MVDCILRQRAALLSFELVYREAYWACLANDGLLVIQMVKTQFAASRLPPEHALRAAVMLRDCLMFIEKVELADLGRTGREGGLPRFYGPRRPSSLQTAGTWRRGDEFVSLDSVLLFTIFRSHP